MSAAEITVTFAGILLIAWVLWYFLVPPPRQPK
jgi:hypothetical protein